MLWIIIGILTSYLIGSIPTAYIFAKALKGVDIRKFGSGNVGATNALRLLGKKAGIAVLFLDILKGFIAVVILSSILSFKVTNISNQMFLILLGIGSICGHNWTIFLNFKGGKGIATTFGVLIGLAFKIPSLRIIMLLVVLTWFIAFIISRIVSLASIAAALTLPVYMVLLKQSNLLFFSSILVSIFAVIRHKTNIIRILEGKEPRLNFKKSAS